MPLRLILARILLTVGLVAVLCGVTLVFLAGRPPQSFAASWTTPVALSGNGGAVNFGAVPEPAGRWDLLWATTDNRLLFQAAGGTGGAVVLDRGEVDQPTLVRVGGILFGAWVHNYNGGTELRDVIVGRNGIPRVHTLLNGRAPIEHPYAFVGPGGRPGLVVSWQKYGNFDVFLLTLDRSGTRALVERRLTVAQYYSFAPQAITDAGGDVDLLHLESCCGEGEFKVEWQRYTAAGTRVGRTAVLASIAARGLNTNQYGEAIGRDGSGDIWGAYTLDGGVGLLHANRDGILAGPPLLLDPFGQPSSVALAFGPRGGYGFWEQAGIGTDIASRLFGPRGMGDIERIEYLSGDQQNVHAAYVAGQYRVLWERLTPEGRYVFVTVHHRKAAAADLAQRLGFGVGNPWGAAALVFGGAIGLGVLGAAINVLDALILTGLGLLILRFVRWRRLRWPLMLALLTVALYLVFVSPGLPIIFLSTFPALGFGATKYIAAAIGGAVLFMGVTGQTGLRRVDDLYRLAGMAFLGFFFIAFIQAALFLQQELGFI